MIGIYKIENLINKKVYIGQSINIECRWNSHKNDLIRGNHINKYLQNAWNKYGNDNFKFEIIEECLEEELNQKEIYWINYYGGCNSVQNYNLASGGNCGGSPSIETREKLSISNRGQKRSIEFCKHLSEINLGKHLTEETKIKIGLARLGRIPWNKGKNITEEHKQRISISNSGRVRSKEANEKTSKTMKGVLKSEETKQKMKKPKSIEAVENMRKAQTGKIAINNGIQNKWAREYNITYYLQNGYILGFVKK